MLDNISPDIIAYIITIILAVLSMFLGKKYKTAKTKFSDVSHLAKELAEALKATSEAIEDDKLSLEEEKKIVKECKEAIEAGKKLLEKP